MSEHKVQVQWHKQGQFNHEGFDRTHTAMASNTTVPMAAANTPNHVDPEQALTFSLASCHMLTFLALAAKKRLVVSAYQDNAVGFLGVNAQGKNWVERIELYPQVQFEGKAPDAETLNKMHEKAHDHCFIANSVLTKVLIKPL